jgi:hypothetical protein
VVRDRGIVVRIARKGIENSKKLGKDRWLIERSIAWLFGYHRLANHFSAFLTLAATLTCYKKRGWFEGDGDGVGLLAFGEDLERTGWLLSRVPRRLINGRMPRWRSRGAVLVMVVAAVRDDNVGAGLGGRGQAGSRRAAG